jgi:hypothetical protein
MSGLDFEITISLCNQNQAMMIQAETMVKKLWYVMKIVDYINLHEFLYNRYFELQIRANLISNKSVFRPEVS